MADIFISYSREDRDWVRKLVAALTREDLSVWWDPDIDAGADYREEIRRELGDAKAVIVVWSNESVKSHWVLGEADEARSLRKLIPVMCQKIALPLEFRAVQTADMSDWPNSDAGLTALLKSVKRLVSGKGKTEADERPLPSQPGGSTRPFRLSPLRLTVMAASLVLVAGLLIVVPKFLARTQGAAEASNSPPPQNSTPAVSDTSQPQDHTQPSTEDKNTPPDPPTDPHANQGWVGMGFANSDTGVVVIYVIPGGRADAAGFRVGDHIDSLDGIHPQSLDEAIAEIHSKRAGSAIHAQIERKDGKFALSAVIGDWPRVVDYNAGEMIVGQSVESLNTHCRDLSQPADVVANACAALINFTNADDATKSDWEVFLGLAYDKNSWSNQAIVEYDAALKHNSANSYALYNRGLAKRQLGDASGANDDIAAAKKINPSIAQ